MQKSLIVILLLTLVARWCDAQNILTPIDSLQLPQANIWSNLSFNGENISVTTAAVVNDQPQLFLRKLDHNLRPAGSIMQLTFGTDPQLAKRLTDHKLLFLNGFHFITFAVAGDSDLYIFRTNKDGQRLGPIVPVIEKTVNRTNDMFLTTDGNFIYAGYFKPPAQTIFHKFDQSLNAIGMPVATDITQPHNNIGSIVFKDGLFNMFTGATFGKNAPLLLTQWRQDWSSALSRGQIIIQSANGDGNWFATGSVYDVKNKLWFIAFHHIYVSDPNEGEHLDLAVFDENFILLQRQHSTVTKRYRPSLLLWDDFLYMSYDAGGQGVFINKYQVKPPARMPVEWKSYFTLKPEEGRVFKLDSTAVIPAASVPGINIANDGRVILGYAGQGGRGQAITNNQGRTFTRLTNFARAQAGDGAFIYLPDGRTRYIAEEPLRTSTPQRHKSRLVSWISYDGINWGRESGVRYQSGAEDDSIASVPAALQVADSVWRVYYVGDWYRTNSTRTAISTDWGWTWRAESRKNILRNHDVDPHPVYLTNGKIRIYHRNMKAPGGIAFTEGDGVLFDTTRTQALLADGAAGVGLLLDPAVIKFPNGEIACYIGGVPPFTQPGVAKIVAAWAQKTTSVAQGNFTQSPLRFELWQNYPNPFSLLQRGRLDNSSTTIRFALPEGEKVALKVFDVAGREVATLIDGKLNAGTHSVKFETAGLSAGVYFYQLQTGALRITKKMLLIP